MANGTVPDKFVVVSRVRSGLKRELQFVLKSQSEICGGSLGRTRARKNPNTDSGDTAKRGNKSTQANKRRLKDRSRLKIQRKKKRVEIDEETNDSDASDDVVFLEEEELKSGVVDLEEAKEDLVVAVDRKLLSDEAMINILEEESASVEAGEPLCEDNGNEEKKGKEKESEKAADGKCEGNGNAVQTEIDHRKVVVDGDENAQKSQTKIPKKRENEEGKNEGDKATVNGSSNLENASDDKPARRFTRSLLKPQGETNVLDAENDAEHLDLDEAGNGDDRGANAVSNTPGAALVKQTEEMLVKDQGESSLVDKPGRRFTRSLLKQEAVLDKSIVRNDAEPASLDLVVYNGNDIEMNDAPSPLVAIPLKRGRPKKFFRQFPSRLKDLLESGILEGLTVYYIKSRGAGTTGLRGVISGSGILCFCYTCKGAQVVTPALFELHASSLNKRPPEYMLLENGKTLRDVMNACKETPLAKLDETLLMVIGSSMKKSSVCFNCQESLSEPRGMKTLVLCNSCMESKEPQRMSQASSGKASDGTEKCVSLVEPKEPQKVSQACTAKASGAIERSPEPSSVPKTIHSEPRGSSSRTNSHGRITRKDTRLHKLVFEEDVLPDGTEVAYFVRGKKMLVGYKKGFGILCCCCNTVVSPSQFEAHAGWAPRRKPFQHIYTSNGVSLHELSVALSRDRKFSTFENDDLCSICWDGGDLLCCDTCPRSFHTVCASLPVIPNGSWSCKYCENMFLREKFVEHNANAIAAGRVVGVDAIAEITKRCIRVVNSLGSGLPSVCVLCRGHSFSRLGFGPHTVIICDQCEKEFHVGCLKEHNIDDLKELPEGQWFCGAECNKIYMALQKSISDQEEKLPVSFLDFVKKKQKPSEDNASDIAANLDIRWRVLSGKLASSNDTKALLSKAVSIFHERFDPISDSGTRGDLIPAMVYGRQFKGHDFSGMYCTILTVNEVIVSVGTFRIFGSEVAELPLVATSSECQGQGYFQCLFSCIERLLGFLNVRNLVLPAANEAKSIWTDKFGFCEMTQDEVNEYRKDFQMMIFDGTSMLRKPVSRQAIDKPLE